MKFTSFARLFGQGWRRGKTSRRARRPRRPDLHRPRLEAFEDRALLSVIPPAVVSGQAIIDPPLTSPPPNRAVDYTSPAVAVDPTNPLNLVEAHVFDDPNAPGTRPLKVSIRAQFSSDGGNT